MNQTLRFLGGMSLGVSAMYILDPNRGRSRRALLRDKAYHLARKTGKEAVVATQDLQHRARGVFSEARSRIRHQEVSDEVLIERIRSRLGHTVSYPREIEVAVDQRNVILKGHILPHEMDSFLNEVKYLAGDREVIDELDVFEKPVPHSHRKTDQHLVPESPGIRLLIGSLAGGALTLLALARKKVA